jgi:hypothetical protein
MKKRSLSPLIAATCALASSVFSAAAIDKPEAKTWREISSGTQSNIEEATQQVIQTNEQWGKWWSKHTNSLNKHENAEAQKPPKVDFAKETVLVVTLGMRSTGGHAIRFSQIVREGESLKAIITTTSPGPDSMVTMALTYPFAVIAIPKHEGPIEFVAAQQ